MQFETKAKNTILILVFFSLGFLFYAFYCDGWFYRGEFFAETGTSYFLNTQNLSFQEQIVAKDYGYYVFLLRTASYFLSKYIPLQTWIAYGFNFLSVSLLIFFFSRILSEKFAVFSLSRLNRLVFGLIVFSMIDFETRTYINFLYAASFILILELSIALSSKKTQPGFNNYIFPFLVVSKPHLLIFSIPLTYFNCKQLKKVLLPTILLITLVILQVNALLNNESYASGNFTLNLSVIWKLLASFTYQFSAIFLGGISFKLPVWFDICVSLLLIYFITVFTRQDSTSSFWRVLIYISIYCVFANLAFNILTMPSWAESSLQLIRHLPNHRHVIIMLIASCFIVYFVIDSFVKKFNLKYYYTAVFFVTWYLLSGWYQVILIRTPNEAVLYYSSNWKQFINESRSLNLEMDCVPIDPLGWAVGNCHNVGENNWLQPHFASARFFNDQNKLEIPNVSSVIGDRSLCAIGVLVYSYPSEYLFMNAVGLDSNGVSVGEFSGYSRKIENIGNQLVLRPNDRECKKNIDKILLDTSSPYKLYVMANDNLTPLFYVK